MYFVAISITFGLYLAATALIIIRLKKRAQGIEVSRTAIFILWAVALALHTLVLFERIVTPDGLNLQFYNALSMVALMVAAILFGATLRQPLENLAIAQLPATAVSLILDPIITHEIVTTTPANSALQIHVLISLLAYSLLAIAMLQALLLAIQDWHLHNRQPGGLIRALPPLQLMEVLLFQLITIGFLFLTLALFSGFLFLEDIFSQHLVHKTALSIGAWLIFAILLLGHWRFGWRGRTAIRWTVVGVIILMLAYFGSKLVLELLLQRT
jgi:ABC-type uncharacterized transport system permease subunit